MKAVEMAKGIYRLGVNIDERGYLFEGLWEIPDGVSINSYVVKGDDKNVVIDLTQNKGDLVKDYKKQLTMVGLQEKDVDYLIVNHMEPDHSGFLRAFQATNPSMQILCTDKAVPLIKEFAGIEQGVRGIKDGESLALGGGRELVFYTAPHVHWPETMVTYETSEKILFSCDAFGSYGSVAQNEIFTDLLSEERLCFYEEEALRYYANIVTSFAGYVDKAIDKLGGLDIKMIAPSHGLIWRKNAGRVIDLYKRFVEYSRGNCEKEVTVVWGSMYGNTRKMLDPIVKGIESEELPVKIYQIPKVQHGPILGSVLRAEGLVLGMPTYEYRMFPPMKHIVDDLALKKLTNKKVLRFGSFGWVGGAQREYEKSTASLKWQNLEALEWQGAPTQKDLDRGYVQGKKLAKLIKGE